MKKTKIIVIAAIGVLGLAALGGVAVRANAADSTPAPDATTLSTAAEAPEADAGMPDTDSVNEQVGDQSGPDDATAEKADADLVDQWRYESAEAVRRFLASALEATSNAADGST